MQGMGEYMQRGAICGCENLASAREGLESGVKGGLDVDFVLFRLLRPYP